MFRRIAVPGIFIVLASTLALAGTLAGGDLRVLPPIQRNSLTIFPIVGGGWSDNAHFLTLDEGLRAGTVVVTETGAVRGLVRGHQIPRTSQGEVNRLVLINDSDRPLLLLAGEVVTGGKQDRVIGADRIIPANSRPVDLSVFCVEPGRWVASSDHFGSMSEQMVQPSVRVPAMADANQQMVWDKVGEARGAAAKAASPVVGRSIEATSSYAKVMQMPEVKEKVTAVTGDFDAILRELRKDGARGVVVAINGRIVWADVFSSGDLLDKYWQKLVRSYAADAMTHADAKNYADQQAAQRFVDQLSGTHEVVETEPGVYRRSEITGEGFKVFTLTSLLPKTDHPVHIAKMAYGGAAQAAATRPMIR